MNKHDKGIDPENQTDHAIGLEIIRVLNLKRKRDNGRVKTTHGDKNPCGLSRTLRAITDPQHEENAQLFAAAPALLEALQVAILRVELANKEGDPILSAWLPEARQAIAQATGEQP